MPRPRSAVPAPLFKHIASLDRPSPEPLGIDFFQPPQTPICQRAQEFILGYLPLWAVHHCYRTWAFGLAIAHYAGWDKEPRASELGFEREEIFLACILHELGFNTKDALNSRLSLEIWGGIKAREWILSQAPEFVDNEGQSIEELRDLADEACEAIAKHTIEFRGFSSRVRLTGAIVSLGSGHDLMGLCPTAVSQGDLIAICEKWPRIGYCEGLRKVSRAEVTSKPACLFEDCLPQFDPAMFDVLLFDGQQGVLDEQETTGQKSNTS